MIHPFYGHEIVREHWGHVEIYLTYDWWADKYIIYEWYDCRAEVIAEYRSRAAAIKRFNKQSLQRSAFEAKLFGYGGGIKQAI